MIRHQSVINPYLIPSARKTRLTTLRARKLLVLRARLCCANTLTFVPVARVYTPLRELQVECCKENVVKKKNVDGLDSHVDGGMKSLIYYRSDKAPSPAGEITFFFFFHPRVKPSGTSVKLAVTYRIKLVWPFCLVRPQMYRRGRNGREEPNTFFTRVPIRPFK